MIAAAILLGALGSADLCRPHDRRGTLRQWLLAGSVGALVGIVLVWGTGASWMLLPAVLVILSLWLYATPPGGGPVPANAVLILLGVSLVTLLAMPSVVVRSDTWLVRWFDDVDLPALQAVPFSSFVLAAACAVFLINSANVIVRIALLLAGDNVAQTEQQLRGGRLLGPLERLFVFFMAIAGFYAALAAVVAAKGIMRFPVISRDDPHGHKAEYVLVGSFVSWALAFVFVPLF